MNMTKEMRDDLITVLYEKCSNGEISRDQREKLIQKANNMFVVTESSTPATVEETPASVELTPKQKYDMFKESVYDRCTKGEITVEMREELLEKARNEFLTLVE